MNRFVATDLEGTLSGGEAWRGIGAYLKATGRGSEHQRFIAAHFVPALLARAGLTDVQKFKNQWLADQAVLFAGSTPTELDTLAAWVVENELWTKRRTAVIDELQKHHDAGYTIIIATGAYDPIAAAFARKLPFDGVIVAATPLAYSDGKFTGKFAAPIGVDALKAQRVKQLVGDGELVAAYGDTAPDVPMLELSRDPVAVSPDKTLAKIAADRGWRILSDTL